MDKSIISMWDVPQCLKEIKERKKELLKEVAKRKVNASDMLHWSNCGDIAFLLLLRSQHLLTSAKYSSLWKRCKLWPWRGVQILLTFSIIPLIPITPPQQKRGKYNLWFKESHERCLWKPGRLPATRSTAHHWTQFISTISVSKQGAGRFTNLTVLSKFCWTKQPNANAKCE